MLAGAIDEKPHPPAISCSIAGGSALATAAGAPPLLPLRPWGAGPPRLCGNTPLPNIIITGTGPVPFAGVTSVM